MADKRVNRFLIAGSGLAVVLLVVVILTSKQESYQAIDQLPAYDPNIKRKDGDTQADTIKALQAYAREAVEKADALNDSTEKKIKEVLENQREYDRLVKKNEEAEKLLDDTKATVTDLEQQLSNLRRDLSDLQRGNSSTIDNTNVNQLNKDGLPVGFGFDDVPINLGNDTGSWYEPIDRIALNETDEQESHGRFSGLLSGPSKKTSTAENSSTAKKNNEVTVDPIYTIPKDSTLTDAIALTALIGRIPVDGQTPDPYPVKIYIGQENLAANGHHLPEVEGMIFSGLGFGDWNLSCVSARLTSATFIFTDGTIVNHSTENKPLGYISDPSGVPCVTGKFVTNAPAFISQRVGLAGLSAAGSAYEEAQQQRQTSPLTGTTTSTITGDIDKLVAGRAVQSATDEVSQWLLARQKQSFDAVVVKPGVPVAVHLDQTLALDKISIARKLRYEQAARNSNRTLD